MSTQFTELNLFLLRLFSKFRLFTRIYKIQATRWLFAHGLAFQACNPPPGMWDAETMVTVMQEGSLGILEGVKTNLALHKPVYLFLREKRRMSVCGDDAGCLIFDTGYPGMHLG